MTRWLDAARRASLAPDKTVLTDITQAGVVRVASGSNPAQVKSVKSVKSAGEISGGVSKSPATELSSDSAVYLAFLNANGPSTYGAAAVALAWGTTRAWKAEAQLKEAAFVRYDSLGKAATRLRTH